MAHLRERRIMKALDQVLDRIADLDLSHEIDRLPLEARNVIVDARAAMADVLVFMQARYNGEWPVDDPIKRSLEEWRENHPGRPVSEYWLGQ